MPQSQGHNGAFAGNREELRKAIQAAGYTDVTEELQGKIMPAFENAVPKARQLLTTKGLRGPPESIDAIWKVGLGVDYRSVLIDIEGKTVLAVSQRKLPADLEEVLIHEAIEYVTEDHKKALEVEGNTDDNNQGQREEGGTSSVAGGAPRSAPLSGSQTIVEIPFSSLSARQLQKAGQQQREPCLEEIIEDFLGGLSEEEKEFIRWRFIERLSLKEVGKRIGKSETTAGRREKAILEKVRDILANKGLNPPPDLSRREAFEKVAPQLLDPVNFAVSSSPSQSQDKKKQTKIIKLAEGTRFYIRSKDGSNFVGEVSRDLTIDINSSQVEVPYRFWQLEILPEKSRLVQLGVVKPDTIESRGKASFNPRKNKYLFEVQGKKYSLIQLWDKFYRPASPALIKELVDELDKSADREELNRAKEIINQLGQYPNVAAAIADDGSYQGFVPEVVSLAEEAGLGQKEVFCLRLVSEEAMVNIRKHSDEGLGEEAKAGVFGFGLFWINRCKGEPAEIKMYFRDNGAGKGIEELTGIIQQAGLPDNIATGGRGLWLIKEYVQKKFEGRVQISSRGQSLVFDAGNPWGEIYDEPSEGSFLRGLSVAVTFPTQPEGRAELPTLSGPFWNRIPFVGNFLAFVFAHMHEGLHWIADLGKGSIDIYTDTEGIRRGRYIAPAEGYKNRFTAITAALAAPIGSIFISALIYGMVGAVMALTGANLLSILLTSAIITLIAILPAITNLADVNRDRYN